PGRHLGTDRRTRSGGGPRRRYPRASPIARDPRGGTGLLPRPCGRADRARDGGDRSPPHGRAGPSGMAPRRGRGPSRPRPTPGTGHPQGRGAIHPRLRYGASHGSPPSPGRRRPRGSLGGVMQLVRVEVRNIRSYERARLDLESGTTLLVGDVGSGKTSLLYAVEMALFGTAEIDATYLVRHGATEATVLVALEEGGHRYEIERAFRRVRRKGRETLEPGRLSFRQDGAATSYSATELRAEVIKLLGFRDNPNPRAHSDLWRWAVYVPQERMREILAAEPLERLETVRKALGVERYRIAAENAKEVARDLRRTSTTLRAQASTLREFSEDFERAVGEVRRLEEERKRVEGSLTQLERELATARERAREAEQRVQAFGPARQRLADLARDETRDQQALEEGGRRRIARTQEVARGVADLEALTALASEEEVRRTDASEAEREVATRRANLELAAASDARLSAAR